MRYEDVRDKVSHVPHMTLKQSRTVYQHLVDHRATRVLELGFAHGTSTCYFAAAMQETGGHVTTLDRESALVREPNLPEMLSWVGLEDYVTVRLDPASYTWALMDMLQLDPRPTFDFVYIDGAHTWDVDGFAFHLVDRLVVPGGWVLFDDMDWTLASSPSMSEHPSITSLPLVQRETAQIRRVFDLLVKTHPDYGDFRDESGWGWARKKPSRPGLAGRVQQSLSRS